MSVFSQARTLIGGRRLSAGKLRCSFCGRDQDAVARLVAGYAAHICDSCIAECVAVLDQHGGFDNPRPTQSH